MLPFPRTPSHTDHRNKPDLVAIGQSIFAADGGEACATRPAEGTSMSTPLAAGAAALVREYLVKGWYPSGSPNASHAIAAPPAALVKAMLVHSALPLDGEFGGQFERWPLDDRVPHPVQVCRVVVWSFGWRGCC